MYAFPDRYALSKTNVTQTVQAMTSSTRPQTWPVRQRAQAGNTTGDAPTTTAPGSSTLTRHVFGPSTYTISFFWNTVCCERSYGVVNRLATPSRFDRGCLLMQPRAGSNLGRRQASARPFQFDTHRHEPPNKENHVNTTTQTPRSDHCANLKRMTLGAVGLVALVTVIAACGDDDDDPNDTSIEVVTSDVTETSVVTVDSEVTVETVLTSEVEITETTTVISQVEITEP